MDSLIIIQEAHQELPRLIDMFRSFHYPKCLKINFLFKMLSNRHYYLNFRIKSLKISIITFYNASTELNILFAILALIFLKFLK